MVLAFQPSRKKESSKNLPMQASLRPHAKACRQKPQPKDRLDGVGPKRANIPSLHGKGSRSRGESGSARDVVRPGRNACDPKIDGVEALERGVSEL